MESLAKTHTHPANKCSLLPPFFTNLSAIVIQSLLMLVIFKKLHLSIKNVKSSLRNSSSIILESTQIKQFLFRGERILPVCTTASFSASKALEDKKVLSNTVMISLSLHIILNSSNLLMISIMWLKFPNVSVCAPVMRKLILISFLHG